MMKTSVLAFLLAFGALAAQAATGVATIGDVTGAVTVSSTNAVMQAEPGMQLAEGNTVLVSSKASATVTLANGCVVSLLGGQHYTVNGKLSCEQSIASVKHLMATTELAQAPLGTGTTSAASGAVAGAGAAADDGSFKERNTALALFGGAGVAVGILNSSSSKASGS